MIQVVEAFKILTSDKQVKAILVNIFGEFPSIFPDIPDNSRRVDP
jgi:succinyl-CoA synthetase beta subunit